MNSARRFQIGLLLSALCVIALEAHAQASWGLAVDGQGQFYFCDITRDRVWKLDREGKLHLLLTETHCHTLMLGYDGNVYGEDIGAEGSSRRGETGVSLWKLTPQGEQRFLLPPTTEPDPSVWIVRDPEGNTYAWNGNPSAKSKSQILKRTPSGSVSVLAGSEWGNTDGRGPDAKFGNVGGMAVAPDGTLYVADEGNLRRVEPDGTVTTLARGLLSTATGGLPGYGGLFNHSLGVAVDAQNSVYVVDFRNRRILKRTPEGSVTTLAQSTGIANALTNSAWGWRPTGIAITANEIYLMEDWPLPRLAADLVGSPRIRKVHPNGTLSTVAQVASPSMRALAGALVAALALLVVAWRRKRAAG